MIMRGIGAFLVACIVQSVLFGEVIEFASGASVLEVHVPKKGLLKFVGHEHTIEALQFTGRLERDEAGTPERIEVEVPVAGLRVTDSDLDRDDQEKVRDNMLSENVLAMEAYPVIRFVSTRIEEYTEAIWIIEGELKIRNVTAPVEFMADIIPSGESRFRAQGIIKLALADFQIEPVTAVGGMMRTGETLQVHFDFIGQTQKPSKND